ncbi:hypothetical protein A2U01_0055469, partial [Trifolium medium]|nr:hypothetical protein [Trifolium medium]
MEPKNNRSLIWTALEWYSPLERWRKELEKALAELYKRKLMAEIKGFQTIFIIHKPYQTDQRTNLLISKPQATLWETVDGYPIHPKIIQELRDFMSLMNFHDP